MFWTGGAVLRSVFTVFFARPPRVSITLFVIGNKRGAIIDAIGNISMPLWMVLDVERRSWFSL